MKENEARFTDITAWTLTAFLYASVFIFGTYSWGRYMLFIISAAIFALSVVRNGRKAFYAPRPWHYCIIAITLFSLASSLWAIAPSDSFQKATTIGVIGVCFSLPYSYYCRHKDGVRMLVDAVKWGGYAVAVYAFFYYGFGTVFSNLIAAKRLENGFCNVNSLGMLAAMSVVIGIYEIKLKKKFTADVVMAIPALIMVMTTQSRKALILLAVGIFAVLILPNGEGKSLRKTLIKALIVAAALVVVGVLLLQLPALGGVKFRIGTLIDALLGRGEDGSSAVERIEMIKLGLNSFLHHPIAGIGIGCTHILVAAELAVDTYTHCNYTELLAGGGIIGFAVFYSMYGYLLTMFIRKRRVAEPMKNLCIIITLLLLIMDVALVSYYSKDLYFMLMIPFLEVERLKNAE